MAKRDSASPGHLLAPVLASLVAPACQPEEPAEEAASKIIAGSRDCRLPEAAVAPDVPPVPPGGSDALFAGEALPLLEVFVEDDAWSQLCENAQEYADWLWSVHDDQHVSEIRHGYAPATLVFQDREYAPVGLRMRGRTTVYAQFYTVDDEPIPGALERCLDRSNPRKPSFKISLDEYEETGLLGGQETLNLVAKEGADGAYLREILAHKLANEFGVPAPRAGHARLCTNGAYDGLFSLVEEVDKQRFLDAHFPGASDGDYWKVEKDGHQDWDSDWDEPGEWTEDYRPVAGTDDEDPGALGTLLSYGEEIDDEDVRDPRGMDRDLEDLLDVEEWLREIALDLSIPDYDGMWGNHKNYLLYQHPERGIMVVPYDRDLAFVDIPRYEGGACPGNIWGAHPCWSSIRQGPSVARWLLERNPSEYLEIVQEFRDALFRPDELAAWVLDRADAMRPWIEADRYYREDSPACTDDPETCGFYSVDAWAYEVDPMLTGDLVARAAELDRQLSGEAPSCPEACPESEE
jgi:hypothetical protein